MKISLERKKAVNNKIWGWGKTRIKRMIKYIYKWKMSGGNEGNKNKHYVVA